MYSISVFLQSFRVYTLVPLYAASNFLTNTQCSCASPLICDHGQIFAVKVSLESGAVLHLCLPFAMSVMFLN